MHTAPTELDVGRDKMTNQEEVFVVAPNGDLILQEVYLKGTMIGPDTTAEQILSYVKRALELSPMDISIRIGHEVRVLHPVTLSELDGANPGIREMLSGMEKAEVKENIILDEEKGITQSNNEIPR